MTDPGAWSDPHEDAELRDETWVSLMLLAGILVASVALLLGVGWAGVVLYHFLLTHL